MRVGLSSLLRVRSEPSLTEDWLRNVDALDLPLEQSKAFTGYLRGYAGEPSPQAEEFRRLLLNDDAEATFTGLAHVGPEGALLYGLCGLKTIRSARLNHYVSLAASDERPVALVNGCSIHVERVREAVQSPRFWAMCEKLSDVALPNPLAVLRSAAADEVPNVHPDVASDHSKQRR
jgi:hypothetical protein